MVQESGEIESGLRPAAVVCADVERYASLVDQHEFLLKFDHLMGRLGQGIRDDLRANSKLKSSEYSMPALGLIFLRYTDYKFALTEAEVQKTASTRRKIGKIHYQAQAAVEAT